MNDEHMHNAHAALPAFPAARSSLFYAAFYRTMARPAVRGSFHRVRVQMLGRLPRPADGPLICYFNHPAWWDLYMGMVIERELLHGSFVTYGMVEEPQMRTYPFFAWLGGFSVSRHDRREASRSINYICRLLQEQPGRALYIFPQGTITPNDRRPLHLYPGAAVIARRMGGAMLCPVALRYEFRGEQRADAFIRFGPLHRASAPVDVAALTAEMTGRLTASADALRDAVLADDMRPFRVLLRGRPGIDRLFAALKPPWSGFRP
jgi:1-acyl-sn-glycerol-3-phosphate acyltransferase